MEKLAGIILDAGLSSRMGAFKPLLEVGGRSMISRVVELMQSAGADPGVLMDNDTPEDFRWALARFEEACK